MAYSARFLQFLPNSRATADPPRGPKLPPTRPPPNRRHGPPKAPFAPTSPACPCADVSAPAIPSPRGDCAGTLIVHQPAHPQNKPKSRSFSRSLSSEDERTSTSTSTMTTTTSKRRSPFHHRLQVEGKTSTIFSRRRAQHIVAFNHRFSWLLEPGRLLAFRRTAQLCNRWLLLLGPLPLPPPWQQPPQTAPLHVVKTATIGPPRARSDAVSSRQLLLLTASPSTAAAADLATKRVELLLATAHAYCCARLVR